MSRYVLAVLLLFVVLTGCSKHGEAPASAGAARQVESKISEASRFLAYEHSIYLRADGDKVIPIFEAAQAACREATDEACAILEARVSSGDAASASLRFRAKAAGIRKLVAILAAQGEVASQSTSAEDLAGPIADTAKQIAMLTDYRTSLESLRSRPSNDLDALMKLTRELADVQSQLETLSGSQAALTQRVQTELLNVSINSHHSSSFFGTIADSAASFSDVLSEGIGAAIIAFAYLLPWAVLIGGITWIALAIRRWRKRQRAQS